MAQTKFDKQVEETAEAVVFGIGRFLAGRPVNGERKTDATFWRKGTRVLPKVEGKVSRSSYRAGWQRLTFRVSGLATIGGGGYWALWENQDSTVATVRDVWENPDPAIAAAETSGIAAASALTVGGLAYGLLTRKRREFMREWITPLHEALAVPLGMSELTDPRRYLHVPRKFSDDDAEIRIDTPGHLRFNEDLVADLIVKKLALENVSFTWRRAGRDTHVIVRKRKAPPKKLTLSDPGVREILAKMPESAPLIGLGAGKKKIAVDLDADSPHVLISAGTGGGKSTILRCITCQFIHNGAHAFVLDFKRISHTWARGVPGVTYCRDIAEIHDALVRLAQEGRRRLALAEELADDVLEREPWRVGPRIVILLEEVNATMAQLKRYWAKIRESGDPKTSPAVDALAEILFMGRQVRLHVLLVAQSATARAIGGPEMRENFSTRILVRYTLNAWRMLVPEVSPIPMPTEHPGRVQVVTRGRAQETQVLNLSNAEAREWAMSGAHAKGKTGPALLEQAAPAAPAAGLLTETRNNSALASAPTDGPAADAWSLTPPADPHPGFATATPPTPTQAPAVPAPTADPDDDAVVGLRKAQQDHLPEITLAALRRARADDPDFPDPADKRGIEHLYRVGDLKKWARNRPRAATGTTDLD
ncbi:helicase HerA domain-containing protein [Streptomyces subrutilus]|uniref:helicase HerA domain-containing protein n=1 Tax=Streptomyces subrutilus TaxID=36818 RepID=UPI002E0ECCF1|nr:pRL2-11 [Streptomyces subrutilus]